MSNALDYVSDEVLIEQYSDPAQTLQTLAAFYGVSYTALHGRLSANPDILTRAQTIKARRCHELSIQALIADPERIADKDGNMRIDPASVTLQKMRSDGYARIAGILDSRLSERTQLDVNHNANGALAEAFAQIAARGSSVPIADIPGRIIEHEPGAALELPSLDDSADNIPLE